MESSLSEFARVPTKVAAGELYGLPIFEPSVGDPLPDGRRISFKADLVVHNRSGHSCVMVVNRTQLTLHAQIEDHIHRVTILNGLVSHDVRGMVVVCDSQSRVLQIPPITVEAFGRIKELCAGIGGLSFGGKYSGFHTTVLCEKQETYCKLVKDMRHAKVMCGDICMLETVAKVFRASPTVDCMGIQPYSSGGDMRGGRDDRAYTLAWGLWHAFAMDAPIMTCLSGDASKHSLRQQVFNVVKWYCT